MEALSFIWDKLGWVVYLWVGFQIILVLGFIAYVFYELIVNKN